MTKIIDFLKNNNVKDPRFLVEIYKKKRGTLDQALFLDIFGELQKLRLMSSNYTHLGVMKKGKPLKQIKLNDKNLIKAKKRFEKSEYTTIELYFQTDIPDEYSFVGVAVDEPIVIDININAYLLDFKSRVLLDDLVQFVKKTWELLKPDYGYATICLDTIDYELIDNLNKKAGFEEAIINMEIWARKSMIYGQCTHKIPGIFWLNCFNMHHIKTSGGHLKLLKAVKELGGTICDFGDNGIIIRLMENYNYELNQEYYNTYMKAKNLFSSIISPPRRVRWEGGVPIE